MTPPYARPLDFRPKPPPPAVILIVTGPTDALVRRKLREARRLVRAIERKRRTERQA